MPHFISYSRSEAGAFVQELGAALAEYSPPIDVWIDQERLRPGPGWDIQAPDAITDCETFVFVMTPDSVDDASPCRQEWIRALKCKKPIILLRLDPGVDPPFQLDGRQWLEVPRDPREAATTLRDHLVWLKTSAGRLAILEDRLRDALRDLRHADSGDRERVAQDVGRLQAEIRELQEIHEDEPAAMQRMTTRIESGLADDRKQGVGAAGRTGPKVVNDPPAVPADSFQDRRWETEALAEYLRNPDVRLVAISGPESIGKTAMVCRLLQRTLAGDPPEGGRVPLDGVVYLTGGGEHAASVPVLCDDLSELLPDDLADQLRQQARDPTVAQLHRLRQVLEALGDQRIAVLIDAPEVNPKLGLLVDEQLAESLRFVQDVKPEHRVTLIVTSRVTMVGIAGTAPETTLRRLALDEGLPPPHAENVLRRLDRDGTVGLRGAPWEVLDRARRLTNGNPMALEAVYAILEQDRRTSLVELLDEMAMLEPDKVLEGFLLREALSRLADRDRQVVEALAIYQCPVRPDAVEDLLQPYSGPFKARPVLDRLVEAEIVRRKHANYYQLPARYWRHVLARIPWQPEGIDWDPDDSVYTQVNLLTRAARHFERAQRPSVARQERKDIAAQLIEFDLWVRAGQHDLAAATLLEVDSHLLDWGYPQEVLERHQRLEGCIQDRLSRQLSLGRMGVAHLRLGRPVKAARLFERALELADGPTERKWWVTNLGSALFQEGRTAAALELYAEGLELAQSAVGEDTEGVPLVGMALCYRDLGNYGAALERSEQALTIAEASGELQDKAEWLEVAATLHAETGELPLARRRLDEALMLARGQGKRLLEASCLADQAEFLLDEECTQEGVLVAERALECCRPHGRVELTRQASYVLALGHLRTGALDRAREVADQAADYHPQRWWHPAAVLQGIVRLRDRDLEGAVDAFARGISEAEVVAEQDSGRYPAHDAMGLGLLGLAVAGQRWQLPAASAAFQAARRCTRAQGVVDRVLRLIDDLAVRDAEGITQQVRAAARGAEPAAPSSQPS